MAHAELAEGSCGAAHSELYCPYCYEEPFALNGLVEHIMDGHGYAGRSVVSPTPRLPQASTMGQFLSCLHRNIRAELLNFSLTLALSAYHPDGL